MAVIATQKYKNRTTVPLVVLYKRVSQACLRVCIDHKLLVIALLVSSTIAVLQLLYLFREIDDNRLLSWQWTFTPAVLMWVIIFSLVGVLVTKAIHNLRLDLFNKPLMHLFLVVLLSFFVSVFHWSNPETIIDSAKYFSYAKLINERGFLYFLSQWGNEINPWTDLPLVPLIYGLLFYVFGENRLIVQAFNTVLFSTTIVIVFYIGKSLWNTRTGLIASWLMLSSPFIFSQIPLMLVDVASVFFIFFAIAVCINSLQKPHAAWLVFASFSVAVACLTKYSAIISLGFIAALPFVIKGVRPIINILIMGLTPLIVALIVLIPALGAQLEVLLSYQLPALNRWNESLISLLFYQIHPFVGLLFVCTVLAVIYRVIFAAKGNKDFGESLKILLPASLVLLLILFSSRSRYFLPVFPFFVLVAAYGIQKIVVSELAVILVALIVSGSIGIALLANKPFLNSTSMSNLKSVASYMQDLPSDNAYIYINPKTNSLVNPKLSLALLDYYSDKSIINVSNTTEKISNTDDMSPVRFSWEQYFGKYPTHSILDEYQSISPMKNIIAIGFTSLDELKTIMAIKHENYHLERAFSQHDHVFRFQTIAGVYKLNE